MSPKEHALSQSVLEFLIAQQDWFILDIAPPPEGSPVTSWDAKVGDNSGFEGKWKEGTQSREGSRVGTPNANAEAGPSVQRGQVGPSKNLYPQTRLQTSPKPPFQQSQPQLQQPQPQPIPQQQYLDPQHSTSFRTSGYGSDVDDVMVIPNSDEEYANDWNMVSPGGGRGGGKGKGEGSKVLFRGGGDKEKEKVTKSLRRRTVMDKSGEVFLFSSFFFFYV